jgi:DNA polymerase I
MKFRFQLLDADYFLNGSKPVVRLFGKTAEGKSVCVLWDRMQPYFYVKTNNPQALAVINPVNIEEVYKHPAIGYSKEKVKLYKVTTTNPQEVPKQREKLIAEKIVDEIYEADILFKYRFMIDKEIRGMQWLEVEAERVNTHVSKIASYAAAEIKPIELNENAPLNYLSLDIECVPSDPRKPLDSKRDPIVMISLSFSPDFRGKKTLVLVAKPVSCEDAIGFQGEKEMLEEFIRIIEKYDPDVITGYNVNGFDFPYILDRLRANKMSSNLGRADKPTFIRDTGQYKDCIITGRVAFDPYLILKRDPWVKFHRYDLNTIAKVMLNDSKHDIEYGEMRDYWMGNREMLVKFIEYSRKDADLALRLVIDKGMMDKFFELSKISGLLLQDCLGGQTRRVETMILHEFRKRDYVMPCAPGSNEIRKRTRERDKEGLKGAIVLEPKKGLHAEGCILVLDFKSLYPSIMRTYNVSPDTVTVESPESHQSPSGAFFIDSKMQEGILPHLLKTLLEARGAAKKQMKSAKSDEEKRILNAKQLAIKDMSNSFYGYTGYIRARLYTIQVANTITAYGRKNIEKTRKLVEENFKVEVVYGDTDSIFVKTNTTNLEEAKELGERIAKFVTDQLPGYLELEFEKIYRTFMILTKKRYAGWKFDKTDSGWKDEIQMRGIETVRRDWCPLVSELMNKVLVIVLKEGDLNKAIAVVKETIGDLKAGKIPMEKLTIVKGITKAPENYDGMLPHIELAKKLSKRNPQDPPKIGDRIGFVIIKGDQLLSKRAEDPGYVIKNNIQLDSDYYVGSQLFPPIERIFNAVGIQKSEVFKGERQTSLGDIMSGKTPSRKFDIAIGKTLDGWEEFICKKCSSSYRRMPLNGSCSCGGELLISYHGSSGDKVAVK